MLYRVVAGTLFIAAAGAARLEARSSDEPYLAIRMGLKCSQCHVNRTGGGGRNAFGNVWAQTQLPIVTMDLRSRNLNDWIAVGFDVRAQFSAAVSSADPQTAFEIPEAQVQIEGQLVPGLLTVYVDQTIGPERAYTREAFGMLQWRPARGYVKAGKLLLPFGWRLWDDRAHIRSETGFTYLTPDLGIEIGIEPGPLSWSVMVSNGSAGGAEGDSQKMITSSAVIVQRAFRVGASASHNAAATFRRNIFGGFGGFQLGPVSVLGEADWILERTDAQSDRRQFIAYAERNLWATRGVNAKVTYGYHDPDLDVPENQRIRMRFGIEVFPVPSLQLAAFYELIDDIPQVTTDTDRVILEAHIHF